MSTENNKKLIGTYHRKKDGTACVIPDGADECEAAVFAEECDFAFDGDIVELALPSGHAKRGASGKGKVLRVVSRKQDNSVGVIAADRSGSLFFEPREYIPCRVPVKSAYDCPVEEGDLVRVTFGPFSRLSELAVIPRKNYGRSGTPEAEIACAVDGTAFGKSFSNDAILQTREILRDQEHIDTSGRRIYNDGIFCPVYSTSESSDTAYGIDCTGDSFIVYVHIADVDAVIKEGTPLADEAFRRFHSVLDASLSKYSLFPLAIINSVFNLASPGEHITITFKIEVASDGKARLLGIEESVVSNITVIRMEKIKQALAVFDREDSGFSSMIRRAYVAATALHIKRSEYGVATSGRMPAHYSESAAASRPVDYFSVPFIFDEFLYAAGRALAHYMVMEGVEGLFAGAELPVISRQDELPLYYRPLLELCGNPDSKSFFYDVMKAAREIFPDDMVDMYVNYLMPGNIYSSNPVRNTMLGFFLYAPVMHPTRSFDSVIQQRVIRAIIYKRSYKFSDLKTCTELSAVAVETDRALRILASLAYLSKHTGKLSVTVVSDEAPILVRTDGGVLGILSVGQAITDKITKGTRLEVGVKSISFEKRSIDFVL